MTDDFWLDESITSYSEAINYLGLFHLYQDNEQVYVTLIDSRGEPNSKINALFCCWVKV